MQLVIDVYHYLSAVAQAIFAPLGPLAHREMPAHAAPRVVNENRPERTEQPQELLRVHASKVASFPLGDS